MTDRYREFPVSPPLDRFVECVWMLSVPRRAAGLSGGQITPDGCLEVIVQLAGRARASTRSRPPALQPAAFLLAPLDGPLRLEPAEAMNTVGIRFRPGGAAAFLPFPLDELLGETPLDAAFGRAGGELPERLAAAGSDEARAALCETFLRERLLASGVPAPGPVGAAVRSILRGRFSVSSFARECGWSRRHLERRFRAETGLTPRLLRRVARFHRVLRALGTGRKADWVSVALDCGYSDQPHLIREFRALSGETPAAFLRPDSAVARVFVAPDRLERFFAG